MKYKVVVTFSESSEFCPAFESERGEVPEEFLSIEDFNQRVRRAAKHNVLGYYKTDIKLYKLDYSDEPIFAGRLDICDSSMNWKNFTLSEYLQGYVEYRLNKYGDEYSNEEKSHAYLFLSWVYELKSKEESENE